MTLLVGLLEIGDGKPGIVPQGVQVLVAQQFFDVVHVRAGPQEFGRTGAPEGVRGHVGIEARPLGIGVDRPEA